MSAIDAAIAEIRASIAELEPEREGLVDYARLDLRAEASTEVNAAVFDYDRRLMLLRNALTALEALKADGHPEMPVRVVPAVAYTDLLRNSETILAALAKFEAAQATAILFSSEAPEPK